MLVPVAIVLRLTGEGEVFFLQERVGKDGKPFKLYKFATMLKNSPNMGTGTVTLKHDPRVLPVGRFLRKTKINELPQLLNILIGDMSVVGPRPQANSGATDGVLSVASGGFHRWRRVDESTQKGSNWQRFSVLGR